jgi:WD40 repeat protein
MLLSSLAAAALRSVAKVTLPCESSSQDLSPDGTQLVAHCKDHSLHLVGIAHGEDRVVVPAGKEQTSDVFSQDGNWLGVGFADGTVRVLSTHDAAFAQEWKASSESIRLLYFLPAAKVVLVGPLDSPGSAWDFSQTPSLRATLPVDFGGVLDAAATPDGKLLVTAAGDTVLRWYDTTTWQKTREYRDFLLDTFSLEFMPDGKQLVAAGADSRITVLDAATAQKVRQMPPQAGQFIDWLELLGDGQQVLAVYFEDVGGKPPHVLIWDLAAGTSVPFTTDFKPTCGGTVAGKFRVCRTEGETLTIFQQE